MPEYWTRIVRQFTPGVVCVLCGSPGRTGLCPRCVADLPVITAACEGCGLPLPDGQDCGFCQRHPPLYQRLQCPLHYHFPVDRLLVAMKFHQRLDLLGLFAELLAAFVDDRCRDRTAAPDVIVPMPLHWRRLATRGYNQATELARPIGKRLGIPVQTALVGRHRYSRPQQGLDLQQRAANVRDCFRVKPGVPLPPHVAIVDDVVTTGNTVNALARVLLTAGVSRVTVWCLARAVLGDRD